jgi:hypothetical protein
MAFSGYKNQRRRTDKGRKKEEKLGSEKGGKHSRERDRTEGGKRRKKPCTAGGVKID